MAEAEIPDAQWPVFLDKKCDLCEINDIKFKCLNCDELLCDNCKKTHLKSKMTKNHKVVCLETAEIYQSSENQTKCPTHTTKDLLLYCVTCTNSICLDCITSGSHQNHEMVKIETLIDNKQAELSKLIRQSKEKSSQYEDAVKTIDKNSREFSVALSQKIEEVKARNNHLKNKLDNITTEYIKQLKERDSENKKAMAELKQRLQEEKTDLNGLIQQYERKRSDRNIEMVQLVTDLTQKLDKYIYNPPDVNCPVPNLITRHVDDQELENLFGYLDIKTTTSLYQPLPQKKKIASSSPVIDVKLVSSFPSKKDCVVTTGNNQAWLWTWGAKGISLVTSDGKVIQNINTDFEVVDAAVSTSGDLLVTVGGGNTVKKLTRNNTFTDIYTADDYSTQGITVTDTGNVLVGLYNGNDSKIVEITTSGQHIRTIQHDTVDNELLFYNPESICTNINGDIIVVDNCTEVVAVNKSGTKRFIYDGKERELKKSFRPRCVVTDKYGNIMITDCNNSVVHMLNQDGKFIQYMITSKHGCVRPGGISIDTSGRLWVGNSMLFKNKVLIVKYL